MRKIVTVLAFIFVLVSTPLLAAEYFTSLDSGLSPKSVAVGNVSSFGDSALDLFSSPIAGADAANNVSVFYSNQVVSDLSYMAIAANHNVTNRWSVGGGVLYERVGGGNETMEDGGEVIALGNIEDRNLECVGNMTYELSPNVYAGISGHYMYHNAFGVTGGAPSFSTGVRYQSRILDIGLSGNYLNSPQISYSNGGQEVRYAQLVGSVRRRGRLIFPVELMVQGKWIPAKSVLLKGVGARVHVSHFLSVSGGYMDMPGIGQDSKGQFTMGVGLNLGNLSFDYAFNQSDYVANENQHKLALTVRY